jgi:hypothetical protein
MGILEDVNGNDTAPKQNLKLDYIRLHGVQPHFRNTSIGSRRPRRMIPRVWYVATHPIEETRVDDEKGIEAIVLVA